MVRTHSQQDNVNSKSNKKNRKQCKYVIVVGEIIDN